MIGAEIDFLDNDVLGSGQLLVSRGIPIIDWTTKDYLDLKAAGPERFDGKCFVKFLEF